METRYPIIIVEKFKFLLFSRIRDIYLSSSFYNKKISKIEEKNLTYKPNPNIVDCIIKFSKKAILAPNIKTKSNEKIITK